MRTLMLSVILILSVAPLHGQTLIEKFTADPKGVTSKLVNLAMQNNPQTQVYAGRVELAKGNNSRAKLSWFDNLNVSYQYVPELNTGAAQSSAQRFGLGFSFNIGNILSTPNRINQTESEVRIAEADYAANRHYLRAETTRRLSNYARAVEMLKIRDRAVNDSESSLILIRHRFENGEATLEEYNQASRTFTDNSERRAESSGDVMFHKASLEEILGVSLEEIE